MELLSPPSFWRAGLGAESGNDAPIPAAAEKGIAKGFVPLPSPAQGRVQGGVLPPHAAEGLGQNYGFPSNAYCFLCRGLL